MSNIGLELAGLGFARGISSAADVNDFFNYCAGSLNCGFCITRRGTAAATRRYEAFLLEVEGKTSSTIALVP